jgi:hypothetical protein
MTAIWSKHMTAIPFSAYTQPLILGCTFRFSFLSKLLIRSSGMCARLYNTSERE